MTYTFHKCKLSWFPNHWDSIMWFLESVFACKSKYIPYTSQHDVPAPVMFCSRFATCFAGFVTKLFRSVLKPSTLVKSSKLSNAPSYHCTRLYTAGLDWSFAFEPRVATYASLSVRSCVEVQSDSLLSKGGSQHASVFRVLTYFCQPTWGVSQRNVLVNA